MIPYRRAESALLSLCASGNESRLGRAHFQTSCKTNVQPKFDEGAGAHEQMYLDAVRGMYEGYEKTSAQERWNRYLAEMSAIRGAYPEDTIACLLYALALVWTAGPVQRGVKQRRKALQVLLPIFHAKPPIRKRRTILFPRPSSKDEA